MFQAKALYDFISDNEEELSFKYNDILTILSKEIGNGWWEASNKNGCVGLVPELYFEILKEQVSSKSISLNKPKIPSKPDCLKLHKPTCSSLNNNLETKSLSINSYSKTSPFIIKNRPLPEIPVSNMPKKIILDNIYQVKSRPVPPKKPDWLANHLVYKDDLAVPATQKCTDNDINSCDGLYVNKSEINKTSNIKFCSTLPSRLIRNPNLSPLVSLRNILIKQISLDSEQIKLNCQANDEDCQRNDVDDDQEYREIVFPNQLPSMAQAEIDNYEDDDDEYDDDMLDYLSSFRYYNVSHNSLNAHSNNNRLLAFSLGSSDSYLFDMKLPPLPDDIQLNTIILKNEVPMWKDTESDLQCFLKSPTKATKFKGLKSFILYEIVLKSTGKSVFRRYKHFDWLYNRLVEKYSTIPIPILPDKQISGHFDEGFIYRRQHRLQRWLDRISSHPVISTSQLLNHFVTCSEPELWKSGKRFHEKDKYQGAMFFRTIEKPDMQIDPVQIEEQFDTFGRFVNCFEDSICHLLDVSESFTHKYKDLFYKDLNSIGICAENLGKSFELSSKSGLSDSLFNFGKTYRDLAVKYYEQPQTDFSQLIEGLLEYRGLVSAFPEILLVYRSSTNGIQENSGQLRDEELCIVQDRADVITWSILVEIERFQSQQLHDFHLYFVAFLQRQLHFFQQITIQLEQCLNQFDNS